MEHIVECLLIPTTTLLELQLIDFLKFVLPYDLVKIHEICCIIASDKHGKLTLIFSTLVY